MCSNVTAQLTVDVGVSSFPDLQKGYCMLQHMLCVHLFDPIRLTSPDMLCSGTP